jgi:hypothetical protein
MNIGFATVENYVAYVQHLPIYLVVDTSRLFIRGRYHRNVAN